MQAFDNCHREMIQIRFVCSIIVMKFPRCATGLTAVANVALAMPVSAVVNIDFVTVGNAGNANNGGSGAVEYVYQISKNETTIAQYAEFLNAVAKTDTYGLYSSSMFISLVRGISRTGVSGSYTYLVSPGSGNRPITYTSWFDAARFCNWAHNGQLSGVQDASTTERGAYTLDGKVSGTDVTKDVGATVWIPSQNEWYKAAYYDPSKTSRTGGGYWQYPNQSDALNGNTVGVLGAANYFDGDYVGSGSSSLPTSNVLTDVGAYGADSESYYGTNDQGGNVMEWTDSISTISDPNEARVLRGGSWHENGSSMSSGTKWIALPTSEYASMGFRVASVAGFVPEPGSLILTMGCRTKKLKKPDDWLFFWP